MQNLKFKIVFFVMLLCANTLVSAVKAETNDSQSDTIRLSDVDALKGLPLYGELIKGEDILTYKDVYYVRGEKRCVSKFGRSENI